MHLPSQFRLIYSLARLNIRVARDASAYRMLDNDDYLTASTFADFDSTVKDVRGLVVLRKSSDERAARNTDVRMIHARLYQPTGKIIF